VENIGKGMQVELAGITYALLPFKEGLVWNEILEELSIEKQATHLTRDTQQGLTVRPELVEGGTVKPLMVRQAHHERLSLKLFRLKWVARSVQPVSLLAAL
jgi:hypothetical protein